jgi:SAM-dependent methyltransferase
MTVDHRFTQTSKQYAADDLETMSEAKRYQAHVFELLRPDIGSRVLEVGCGIGTTSLRFAEIAERLVCIEPNPNCVARARAALDGNPRIALHTCHLEECNHAEMVAERFNTVVCVNVLEHIEDDVRALTTFRDLVAPTGGKVLIFVPAVQAAYGPLDAALGHHRRYSKRTLSRAFDAAGLDLLTLRYSNPIGLLGWMYNSHVSKAVQHTPEQVRLFEQLVAPWALPLDRLVAPPIGQSLYAVGRARVSAA